MVGPTDREDRGILAFDLHSEGAHAEKLWVDSPGSMYHPRVSTEHIEAGRQYLDMDGKEVFRHAVVADARVGPRGARRQRAHDRGPQAAAWPTRPTCGSPR